MAEDELEDGELDDESDDVIVIPSTQVSEEKHAEVEKSSRKSFESEAASPPKVEKQSSEGKSSSRAHRTNSTSSSRHGRHHDGEKGHRSHGEREHRHSRDGQEERKTMGSEERESKRREKFENRDRFPVKRASYTSHEAPMVPEETYPSYNDGRYQNYASESKWSTLDTRTSGGGKSSGRRQDRSTPYASSRTSRGMSDDDITMIPEGEEEEEEDYQMELSRLSAAVVHAEKSSSTHHRRKKERDTIPGPYDSPSEEEEEVMMEDEGGRRGGDKGGRGGREMSDGRDDSFRRSSYSDEERPYEGKRRSGSRDYDYHSEAIDRREESDRSAPRHHSSSRRTGGDMPSRRSAPDGGSRRIDYDDVSILDQEDEQQDNYHDGPPPRSRPNVNNNTDASTRPRKFRNRDPLPSKARPEVVIVADDGWEELEEEARAGMLASRKRKLADTPMTERPICRFYMEGKCVKGNDCSFNHDCVPARKPDLCKYYLHGTCHRGKTCTYYHDWPCKSYHNSGSCKYAETCKFSHSELTDATRKILEWISNYDEETRPPPSKKPMTSYSSSKLSVPSLLSMEVYPPGYVPKPPRISTSRTKTHREYGDEGEEEEENYDQEQQGEEQELGQGSSAEEYRPQTEIQSKIQGSLLGAPPASLVALTTGRGMYSGGQDNDDQLANKSPGEEAEAAYNSWNGYDDFADYDENDDTGGQGLTVAVDYTNHQGANGMDMSGTIHPQPMAAIFGMNQQQQQPAMSDNRWYQGNEAMGGVNPPYDMRGVVVGGAVAPIGGNIAMDPSGPQSVSDIIKSLTQQQQQQVTPNPHGMGLLPSPVYGMQQRPQNMLQQMPGMPPHMHSIPPRMPPPGMVIMPPHQMRGMPMMPPVMNFNYPPPQMAPTPSPHQILNNQQGEAAQMMGGGGGGMGTSPQMGGAMAMPKQEVASDSTNQMPSFDINHILSVIRASVVSSTPSVSQSPTTEHLPSTNTSATQRGTNLTSTTVTPDPRLRPALPPPSSEERVRPETTTVKLPETSSTPSSPPSQTPQSPDAENEPSMELFAGLGRMLNYVLRPMTLDGRPTIPLHISLEELERKKDPRLNKYHRLPLGNAASGNTGVVMGTVGGDDVKRTDLPRASGRAIIPWSDQDRVDASVTARGGQDRPGERGGDKRTPPHTLPDIVLPIIPVANEQRTGKGGTPQSASKENGVRPSSSRASVKGESPSDRIYQSSPNQPGSTAGGRNKTEPGAKQRLETLAPPVPAALKQMPKIPDALLERYGNTDVKPEVKDEPKVTKKVIDYRNDPRYKKKKTKSSASMDSVGSTNEPGNKSTTGDGSGLFNGVGSIESTAAPSFNSSSVMVEPPSQFFTDSSIDNSSAQRDAKKSLTTEDKARQVISMLLHNEDHDESSPTTPTTPSSEHIYVPSFLTTNPTLIGASGHYIDEDDDDEEDEMIGEKSTLKAMFKTIDPTTSPFC